MKLTKRSKPSVLAPIARGHSPLWPVRRLRDEIDRLFDQPFGFGEWLGPTTPLFETGWAPAADVYEDKDNVFVKAELPGMKKEDIDVSVSGNMLNIAGERKEESEYEGTEGYRAERYFGHFQRGIALPTAVESDKIHAEYKDGVLTVTCPKTAEAKRKQIDIKVE
jgi:HSP20 family protein